MNSIQPIGPFPSIEIKSLAKLSLVLVSPRNTLNIGAVARAMSNFGAADLRVANIFYKDFRSASSAVGPSAELLRRSREFPSTAAAVEDAQLIVGTSGATDMTWQQPLERLEVAAQRVRATLDSGQRVALLFGSEKFGLSKEDMSHCDLLVRIPTVDAHPSMNLGQAAALCLYELARVEPASQSIAPQAGLPAVHAGDPNQPVNPAPPELQPADALTLERLTTLLVKTLTACEYPGMTAPSGVSTGLSPRTRQLRIILRRLHCTNRDAMLYMGFLRQMLWKLQQKPAP
jgi:TrmH family RNA methyltransferase